jgi:hypothetical protein
MATTLVPVPLEQMSRRQLLALLEEQEVLAGTMAGPMVGVPVVPSRRPQR